jgi:hypothetical protein
LATCDTSQHIYIESFTTKRNVYQTGKRKRRIATATGPRLTATRFGTQMDQFSLLSTSLFPQVFNRGAHVLAEVNHGNFVKRRFGHGSGGGAGAVLKKNALDVLGGIFMMPGLLRLVTAHGGESNSGPLADGMLGGGLFGGLPECATE